MLCAKVYVTGLTATWEYAKVVVFSGKGKWWKGSIRPTWYSKRWIW